MAISKRLDRDREKLIAEQLRAGRSAVEIARALSHDPRTVLRVAGEWNIRPASGRKRTVPIEMARGAAHLLSHSRITIPELAASFGVSVATLKRRLHAAGYRGYGRHLRPPERARIDELLGEGRKPPEVARLVGRHLRTVERIHAARRGPREARAS